MNETKECAYCKGEGGFWHDLNSNVWVICPKCHGRGKADE